ncbi:reverse transcriptase [Cucumis melo var. makuwa]|uniref:Reverse transcriptase n=1 Tax=Cucumis melo var. makuwa TaxID=1194695 RepID=A0A5A7VI40_CUCMM|nr:reverse transcriptase [Cucumis melo var. makuwa]
MYEFRWMNKKIVLLLVNKKNEDGINAKHSGHTSNDSSGNIPPKIQDLLDQYPGTKDEPSKLPLYRIFNIVLTLAWILASSSSSLQNEPKRMRNEEDHYQHLKLVFKALEENKLYINMKKCTFCAKEISFLGFIIGNNQVKMDEEKVEAIVNRPIPKSIKELSSHPVLKLSEFDNPFEVVVDACGAKIRAVLSQGGHLVEFFSEKASISRQSWNTYEQEFYALVRALKQWVLPIIQRVCLNHGSFPFEVLTSTEKYQPDARLLDILHPMFQVLHQTPSQERDKVADALSRKGTFLTILSAEILA